MRIVFDPHAMPHVPVQLCPTVPVRMDQFPASRCADPLPRDFHRTARGCLVSPEGWATRSIVAISRRKHWTTYYKLIERGSVRTLRLARALFRMVLAVLPFDVLTLVIDDTLVPRSSASAPGCACRHDHSRKTNRPTFMLAQCWVTVGVSVLGHGGAKLVLPIVSRLVPASGNRNKLLIALATAARLGRRGRQAGPGAVRFLVYARPSDVAFSAATDSGNRAGTSGHGAVSPAGGTDDAQARAQAHLWRTAERRGGSAQPLNCDVVHQRRETHLLMLLRQLPYTIQSL
jgi:hypothetical protein